MTNFSIRFPEAQLGKLRDLSRLTGLTESDLIRQCVNLYLPILRRKLSPPAPTRSEDLGGHAEENP